MGAGRNQKILSVRRKQNGVETHTGTARIKIEHCAIWEMAIHCQARAMEGVAGWRKDNKVQARC